MRGSGEQGRSRAPGSGQCELSAGSEPDRLPRGVGIN